MATVASTTAETSSASVDVDAPKVSIRDTLLVDLHARFVRRLDERKDSFHYWTMQHLQMNGVYWGLGAMHVLGRLGDMDKAQIVDFVQRCQNDDGGYGGYPKHDSHMLYTLSAVQVLCILGEEDKLNREKTAQWVASRQIDDGSFTGDQWGEIDTRYVYCAFNCLGLLGKLDLVDVEAAVGFVLRCQNWDSAFGMYPGAESHAAFTFCAVGVLAIGNALDRIDIDKLGWWLAERQIANGGLNGRPEKAADVCYSWWVLSTMAMIRRLHWIDRHLLFDFILSCQDDENGGIADQPNNYADVFHTFFGACGLSLLRYDKQPLQDINPVFAMPPEVLRRLKVPASMGSECPCRIPLE